MPLHLDPTRRRFLGALSLPFIAGCSTPLPLGTVRASDPEAERLLQESAEAHGLVAFRGLDNINVAYAGEWRPLIGRIQPEITDTGFRGRSEERLMPKLGLSGQAYRGASGAKQVAWRRGPREVAVWFNGVRSTDVAAQQAAALVAEAYGLFLLGPLCLVDRRLPAVRAGTERVDGRLCDVVEVWAAPGLGQSDGDRIAFCIDRDDRITRRLRFTLEGFPGSKGAVAETDTFEHRRLFGIVWPMRSHERVRHPIALPAHDWHIAGLDVNRGYSADAVLGAAFTGLAAAPAAAVR